MNITKNNICIIPARGGSKRIPRKNIKDFLGKPIIAYSIETALESGLFDEVMVSTDDEEIAEVAQKYGAKVPFMRSKKSADDFATTYDVIEETIKKYSSEGKNFEFTCCLYPCAPFVKKEDLSKAFELLKHNEIEAVFMAKKIGFPIQRSFSVQNEKIDFLFPEHQFSRSQDLKEFFHDAGQMYFYQTAAYLQKKGVFNCISTIIEKGEMENQDIDTLDDWKLAEMKYKLLNEKF